MEDDKGFDLPPELISAIDKRKAEAAEVERKKIEEEEKTQRVSAAAKDFLRAIGAKEALKKINLELFDGKASVEFNASSFQREDIIGSGLQIGGGSYSPHPSRKHEGFFAGFLLDYSYYRTIPTKAFPVKISRNIFVGFAGVLTNRDSRNIFQDPKMLNHFLVSQADPSVIFRRYNIDDPRGQYDPGFHTWSSDYFPITDGEIKLDFSGIEAQNPIDKVVSLISPTNIGLLRSTTDAMTQGLVKIIGRQSK